MSSTRQVPETLPRGTFEQRNIKWAMLFTRLLAKSERLRSQFPLEVPVVFLPEDDPELTKFNLELASRDPKTVLVKVVVGNEPSSEPDYRFIGYEPKEYAYT